MMATDYDPYLIGFPRVPAPITYRGPYADLPPGTRRGRPRRTSRTGIIAADPSTVAAFIVEPVMGNGAMAVLPDGYLQLVRGICDRHGILLIVDEVMTGAGRTGTFLRVEALGVTPDLLIMAKAISGGYAPLGAVLLHERVSGAIIAAGRRMDHVHTHSGHPVSCAVGLAVLDILEREGLVAPGRGARSLPARRARPPARATIQPSARCAASASRMPSSTSPIATPYARSRPPPMSPVPSGAGCSIAATSLPSRRYQDSDVIGDYSLLAPAFVISEAEIREGVSALRTPSTPSRQLVGAATTPLARCPWSPRDRSWAGTRALRLRCAPSVTAVEATT